VQGKTPVKMTTRRQALALLSGATLAGCSSTLVSTEGDPLEGGIGGTGIVGVLVGFGSLLVNGLRIETPRTTRYHTPFGRISLEELAPGLPLTIYSQRRGGQLAALDVGVDYALVGTVAHGAQGFTVNGVPVRAEVGARGHLLAGTRAIIGGTWTRMGVSASYIAPAPDVPDLIAGTVNATVSGSFEIGPTRVLHRGGQPAASQYAVALGRYKEDGFEANEVQLGRFQAAPDLRQLSVDGYLEPIAAQPSFRLAGLGHSFAKDLRLAQIGARRALYFGRYNGRFDASTGYIIPDSFAERQELLRDTGLGLAKVQRLSI